MSRNDLLVRVAAALGGIVAIALAAATIDTPIDTGGSGGSSAGSGAGTGTEGIVDQPGSPNDVSGGGVPPFLEYLFYALLIIVVIALVWYLLANRREAVSLIAVALLAALGGILLFSFLEFDMASGPAEMLNRSAGSGSPAAPGSGDGEATDAFPTNPLFAALAIITTIFVGGVLLSRGSGTDDGTATTTTQDEDATRGADAAAVGTAAGRAADRIDESTDLDNEIYRAWREMTRPLDVDRPDSSTPREFASAAVDAGLTREHVDELTRLFEDVRYGSTESTPELEERAVTILRRIEREYGDMAEPAAADSERSAETDAEHSGAAGQRRTDQTGQSDRSERPNGGENR
ncbi:DUF4129 domain-containing protein [Natrialba asiatica]|uniref:Protein-glutamine gamma-glutamyltransferase-like C-terminal domain-containing protein n=1 Tax=Natrialba asiatica (strain ATCC 700177 / DSM 12278 / JCM 9576 / FERM P-10747 / NBRC 102637 / 172P1) TaxID=29540 RepID=M0AUG8_NATA1|nr:DUF4129 domain-containing protein [Natrialba asiatica]ELZ02356.1 hypothetical protein C481_06786 [Natrialba asiatica DSM 12278]